MGSLRFDDYLTQVRADELKRMARLWGASSQCRKDECVAIIRSGLQEPSRVQAAVAALDSYELNALALAKEMGGEIEGEALAMALRASGVALLPQCYSLVCHASENPFFVRASYAASASSLGEGLRRFLLPGGGRCLPSRSRKR